MAATELHTASEVVSFARQLETESADFYRALSQKSTAHQDILLSFARENEKNITQLERAYYGAISDAIEGCFAFAINPDEYRLDNPPDNATISDGLSAAIAIEQKMMRFYLDAEYQSRSLMADVPRILRLLARKRAGREATLRKLPASN